MRFCGRRVVLLGAVVTLVLLSSSAASGDLDENVRDFGKFVDRWERPSSERDVIYAHRQNAARAAAELKQLEAVESVDAEKPAKGFVEKARSFLSGIVTSVGRGISNPASLLWEKKHRAVGKTEKAFGRKGFIFGRHWESGQSRWAGIRDLIHNHPKKLAAAADGVSVQDEVENLAQDEHATPVTPVSGLRSRIIGLVTSVVEEYNAGTVDPNLASTCADVLEVEVKTLVKSVKSALQERICNDEVDSKAGRSFCNVFNKHPNMATFQSLWMTHVNPVMVSWQKTSKTDVCSSVNPFSSFLDSLHKLEGIARQYSMLLPEVMDSEVDHLEHDREHHMFDRFEHEHTGPERIRSHIKHDHSEEMHEHLGQDMLRKGMKHHRFEKYEHEDHEKHEHEDYKKHGWQRLFAMLRHHKQKQAGFDDGHEISAREECLRRNVKYLSKGMKQHLATTCETATSPKAVAACEFAREHHFLVKAWLAVKMPVWSKAAKRCMPTFEDRRAADLGIGRFAIVERTVSGEDAFNEAGMIKEREVNNIPPWIPSGCARNLANRGFSKALHLRGHMIGINHVDGGLQGPVRTNLIIFGGHPIHRHNFQDALENLRPEHMSPRDALTKLRMIDIMRGVVPFERRALPDLKSETTIPRPFHGGAHFRISANPRVLEGPLREGTPRVFGPNDVIEEVVGREIDTDVEVQLQDKITRETTENIANM